MEKTYIYHLLFLCKIHRVSKRYSLHAFFILDMSNFYYKSPNLESIGINDFYE